MSKNISLLLLIGSIILILIATLMPASSLAKTSFFDAIPYFDKIIHFLLFGLLAYLFARYLTFYFLSFKKILYIVFFSCLAFGILTELLQYWTFDYCMRTFQVQDIYADGTGITVALLILLWTYKK